MINILFWYKQATNVNNFHDHPHPFHSIWGWGGVGRNFPQLFYELLSNYSNYLFYEPRLKRKSLRYLGGGERSLVWVL